MSEPEQVGPVVAEAVGKAREAWLRRWGPEGPPEADPVMYDDTPSPWMRQRRAEAWAGMIPARFRAATVEDFDAPTRDELLEWATGTPEANLLLLGDKGTGKTHAGIAASRVLFEAGHTVMYAPVVEVLDGLRPDGGMAIDELYTVGVLLLDDLGAERPSDWTAERLYAVVNRRWAEARPIVVTTNLEPGQLRDTLDPRVHSRLTGSGSVAIRLSGPDRRKAKR